jgi:hypothetical protein
MKVVTQVEIVDRPGRPPPVLPHLLRHLADLDLQGIGCLKAASPTGLLKLRRLSREPKNLDLLPRAVM